MLCIGVFFLQLPLFIVAIAAADRFIGTWTYMALALVVLGAVVFVYHAYIYYFVVSANRLWGPVQAVLGGLLSYFVPGFLFLSLLLVAYEARKRLREAGIPLGFFVPLPEPS